MRYNLKKICTFVTNNLFLFIISDTFKILITSKIVIIVKYFIVHRNSIICKNY